MDELAGTDCCAFTGNKLNSVLCGCLYSQVIEVFCLPSYSPELNPYERMNGDLKQDIEAKVPCRTKDELRQAASDLMAAIEKNPDRIKVFFKDPLVAYAA